MSVGAVYVEAMIRAPDIGEEAPKTFSVGLMVKGCRHSRTNKMNGEAYRPRQNLQTTSLKHAGNFVVILKSMRIGFHQPVSPKIAPVWLLGTCASIVNDNQTGIKSPSPSPWRGLRPHKPDRKDTFTQSVYTLYTGDSIRWYM